MNRVHYGAVVVSGIVVWLLQACWYTILSQQYVAAIGMTPEQVAAAKANVSWVPYVTALLGNIVMAYVLSVVLVRTGPVTVQRGLLTGFVLWMGLVATVLATNYSFEQRPFSLFVINGGCTLVGMLLTGLIVGAWRAKAPVVAN